MFVRAAKDHGPRLAIIDKTTGHRVTYRAALMRSLILSRKFDAFDHGMIGVMMPTSAGGILSVLAAVMSGRSPVMINYSTGAAQNCRLAQRRLAFRTIITSRGLLDRLKCPKVEGMVFIEDIAADVSRLDAVRGMFRASRSADSICRSVWQAQPDENVVVLFTSGSPSSNPYQVNVFIFCINDYRT
jgi:acyl-[acyl-carrier-protein]-phospholipid O-acyltransferase/long-chain-fatty-acid--[acyl-carrier-protein] ligase